MRGWTIGRLIALVALLALGMASLRDPECEWAEIVPAIAAAVIVIAAAIAILRRGRAPAYWAFAVAGGAYFLASWPIGPEPRTIPLASGLAEKVMLKLDQVTNPRPLDHSRVQTKFMPDIYKRPEAEQAAIFEEWRLYGECYRYWDDHRPKRLNFGRKIAHSWFSLGLGGPAAIASSLIFGRRSRYDETGVLSQAEAIRPEPLPGSSRCQCPPMSTSPTPSAKP